ncbi:S8 family serine peptidase [Pendulispora albinea]|uniref:S8 family serine peptidase n=1 Tax=Pendulispora albinea TaxID=2741071 RepID=A0ABZ2LZV6_9BACT
MKRIGVGAAVLSMMAGFVGCSTPSDESHESTAALGDGVEAAMAVGHAPSSVLVFLKGSADLAPSEAFATKAERTASVHTRLVDHAKSAQKPLLEWLHRQGADVKPFHIVNAVLVTDASPALLQKLAARADVARLMLDRPIRRELVQESESLVDRDGAEPGAIATVGPNITATGAPRVWSELRANGTGVVIGSSDTGVSWTHPTLKTHYRGWNGTTADHSYSWHDAVHKGSSTGNTCGYDTTAPCDDQGHGTHTVGTMVGDDGAGNQIGMAPGAKWIGCRNMDANVGKPSTYIECTEWFMAPYPQGQPDKADPSKAADIINNSWGCPASEGCQGSELQQVLKSVRAAGIVFVAAAGNSGSGCGSIVDQPATISAETLSVGAVDHRNGTIASFSSRGPSKLDQRLGPDVSAPGVSVRSAYPGNGYSSMSGTSMASPHVVGEIALVISAVPTLRGKVDELTKLVTSTATPKTSTQTCGGVSGSTIPNNTYGAGNIDAYKAVNTAKKTFESTTSTETASSEGVWQ